MLHRIANKEPGPELNPPTKQENIRAIFKNEQSSQVKKNSLVLLQVIPATIHQPSRLLKMHAMLHTGSTCSLIVANVSDKLGLKGSQGRIVLNGIQGTSELI